MRRFGSPGLVRRALALQALALALVLALALALVLQALALPPSSSCSSPDWYISIMMSEPPTNSPLT